jgi:tetratricopeptide (TPR) repeat protein
MVNWQIGEVDEAARLFQEALTEATTSGHVLTVAQTAWIKAALDAARGDAEAADKTASMVFALSREHGMQLYIAWSEMPLLWAQSRLGDRSEGASKLRRTVANYMAAGNRWFAPFYTGLLAELDASGPAPNDALAQIDAAIALAQETGERWSDSMLHRIRGEILLDPTNPGAAEEAFQTAIAVAHQQGARSFGLQAALSLANLYRSTSRPAEAHAVLAPALEGFAPTPEMPQIAEAQLLLGALAETEEVRAAEAQRQRRAHLQTAYGQAVMWAKGFSAEETRAAFLRAAELTAKGDSFADRFAAAHVQWTFALVRGELQSSRQLASEFLKEAEAAGRVVEAGVARRGLAIACYQAADFLEARIHCERALEDCDLGCERATQERFHEATGPVVMSILTVTMWQFGRGPTRARTDRPSHPARDRTRPRSLEGPTTLGENST